MGSFIVGFIVGFAVVYAPMIVLYWKFGKLENRLYSLIWPYLVWFGVTGA